MSVQSKKEDPDETNISKLYEVNLKYPLLPFSILFLSKVFSILPLQVTTQSVTNKFSPLLLIYSLVMLFVTLYHIAVTPSVVASLQYESKEFNITSSSVYYRSVQIAFPVLLSVAAVVSKFTSLFMLKQNIMKLYKCVYYSDLYNSAVYQKNNETYHNLVSIGLITACVLLNLALNVIRYNQMRDTHLSAFYICFFLYMYFNSLQVYISELQFIVLAYGLYIRFHDINQYLYNVIRENSVFYNKNYNKEYLYTKLLVRSSKQNGPFQQMGYHGARPEFDAFNKNFLNLKCNTVANLRTSHIFLCDALSCLNSIYDYVLISALVTQFITTLLDIYYEFFGIVNEKGHSRIRTYLWIIQYCVRFVSLVQISNVASSEARKARTLIANISNRHLDTATKEELFLFSNHIASRNLELTAGGFFSLNTHLITSAIAAGTTYLVILVQFNTS